MGTTYLWRVVFEVEGAYVERCYKIFRVEDDDSLSALEATLAKHATDAKYKRCKILKVEFLGETST